MIIMFADFTAACDSVDRRKIVRAMRKRRVNTELIKRCEQVLRKTKRRVRVGERRRGILDREGDKTGLSTEF